MGVPVHPLLEYLHSLYALLNQPFPDLTENALKAMADIVVMEKGDYKESPNSYSQVFSQSSSQARGNHMTGSFHNRQLWMELHAVLDPCVLENVLAQTVYAKFPGNRWLLLSGTPVNNQWVKTATTATGAPQHSVHKVECLYRTNWNKKCPLGVSNIMHAREFVTPEIFSQSVLGTSEISPDAFLVDALWTLRQNCSDIGTWVDRFLGSTCPLPELDSMHLATPLDVLRTVTLLDYATSAYRVSVAVTKIVQRILPAALWESVSWDKFVRHYVAGLTRFETLEVPNRMVAFVFRKVIVPLISYMFYATDASGSDSCEIFYFRRPLWDLVTTKASKGLVELLGLQSCSTDAGLAGAKVRWAPKKSGMRPIVVQPPFMKEKTRKLLLYLNAVRQGKLGCSLLTRAACHDRLLAFVENSENTADMCYLSADIQNCFESIPFEPLSQALAALAPETARFSSVMISSFRMLGSVPPRKRALVFTDARNLIDQIPPSPDPNNPNIIIVHKETLTEEKLNYQNVQSEIFRVLTSSVYRLSTGGSTTTTVKYKVSNRGLPQGLSLSVMLVSIFYGWLDSQWSIPGTAVMVRLVDDILCLCSDKSELEKMYHQIVDLGTYGTVNRTKLEYGKIDVSTCVSWAGFQLRPFESKLNIRTSSEKSGKPPRKFRDIDSFFRNFLGRSLAQNALPLLFCATINSPKAANENAFRLGVMAARKLQVFLASACDVSDTEFNRFAKKLDRFVKRRFGKRNKLLKQFRYAFEKTLSNR